ncbi:MAG: PEP-CTERM sorting domain-containing protein [Verrucomicrobia bacterium]|nr:PEP-CTERM sorting domain-containing protein [Verrucomicrobiota bacterium]
MKNKILLTGLMAMALAGAASATMVVSDNWNIGQVIADGSPVGMTVSQTFGGLDASAINDVTVRLNLTGGYNGDLYGYLVLQSADLSTTTAILLDRIGPGAYGNSGSTISVTLSGNIAGGSSFYLGDIGSVGATGNVTTDVGQNYTPDGNATALSVFNSHIANGTWTLFLADLSSGSQSTLVSWGLDISVVPEPATWALIVFGSLVGICAAARRVRRRQAA